METIFKYMYQASTPDSSTPHKKLLPVVLITTHGNYKILQETTGTGIVDKVEEVKIIQRELWKGMKIHKIEAAGLGVCTITTNTNIYDVYENIKRYMHDERTLEQFVNELVGIFENIHKTHIENIDEIRVIHGDDNHELINNYAKAFNRGEMNTYQEINSLDNRDPNKKPLFHEKFFTRDIKKDLEDSQEEPKDLERYNNREYDVRINLIEPEQSRFDNRYSGPKIQDIYDDVIEYQKINKRPDDEVLLSEVIGYIKNIKKINEFIIVDLSCSVYNDVISKKNGKFSTIEPHEIDLARATRLFRRNSSSDIIRVDNRSPLTLVDRPRTRDNSPDRKGGKRTKKYRSRKPKSKKTNRRRKLTHKRRKTCKNKKLI